VCLFGGSAIKHFQRGDKMEKANFQYGNNIIQYLKEKAKKSKRAKVWELEKFCLSDVKEFKDLELDFEDRKVTIPIAITKDGKEIEFRNSIVKELGALIESGVNVNCFKVVKVGEGINTKYSVILLDSNNNKSGNDSNDKKEEKNEDDILDIIE